MLELKLLYYLFLMHLALVIIQVVLYIVSKFWSKASKLEIKIRNYLYWNGFIRFFIEAYLDFALLAMINLRSLKWDTAFTAEMLCNVFAVSVVIAIIILPIVLTVFFLCKKSETWKEKSFKQRYGSFIDGANMNMNDQDQWKVISLPVFFFMRRLLMCIVIVITLDHFFVQVSSLVMLSTLSLILLG